MSDTARSTLCDYDAIVVGTGFGGAATAARLVQAGLRVLVLERGARYQGNDFPALPREGQALPDSARFLWHSSEGRLGLWDVRDLGSLHAVGAAGYGGGSLIYANVHLRAPSQAFEAWPNDPQHPDHRYDRTSLDAYYDLAAYMLDVVRIDDPDLPKPQLHPLRKTLGLRAAAATLGREGDTFSPPLAVRFAGTDTRVRNKFAREQGSCRACGECDSGCRFRAKNSLDMNYLAIVEDARDEHDAPLAEIRTLAEVFSVARLRREGEAHDDGFRVRYHDHHVLGPHVSAAAEGGHDETTAPLTHSVTARYVFLCAGAIGSTELLLRNREALGIRTSALGRCFHGNADAVGVVMNTQQAQEPHVGPVITTAMVHRGARRRDPWLLVQDGGYGAGVHRLVRAVFASPAWLGRNRYTEQLPAGVTPMRVPDDIALGYRWPAEPALPVRRNATMFEGLYRAELAHELTGVIPPQVTDAALAIRAQLERALVEETQATIEGVQQLVEARTAERWALALVGRDHACFEPLHRFCLRVTRWLGRVMRGMVEGSALLPGDNAASGQPQLALAHATAAVLSQRYELQDHRRAFVRALSGLANQPEVHPDPTLSRTMVLLTMGRDHLQHVLRLHDGELSASARPYRERVYTMQERVLRDVASALGGELRVNPAWSQAQTPITVHGQGGAVMSTDVARGVVDVFGEAHECPGLYVMDGAAFPSSVGVNPSATILAVTERNVERFIRTKLGLTGFRAREWDQANAFASARRGWLAPAAIDRLEPSPTPTAQPVGIRFTERMLGFHSSRRNAPASRTGAEPPGLLGGPKSSERRYSSYEACYLDGRKHGCTLELELDATIEDLSVLLEDRTRRAAVAGHVVLHCTDGASLHPAIAALAGRGPIECAGTMGILTPGASTTQRFFRYVLQMQVDGETYDLIGHKRLRDDPGRDEWQDTVSLFFRLHKRGHREARSYGVVRVALDDFVQKQLPSMHVTGLGPAPLHDGKPDPAGVLWTLASFGHFFFGNLWDVYMRETRWAARLAARSLAISTDDQHASRGGRRK